jgi:hypothetical protein
MEVSAWKTDRWKDNIKRHLRKTVCKDGMWMNVAQDRVHRRGLVVWHWRC